MDYYLRNRDWMYIRKLPNEWTVNPEFYKGLVSFVDWACQQPNQKSGIKIRCPCVKCKNCVYEHPEKVKEHLLKKGFVADYYRWTCHGEEFLDYGVEKLASTSGDLPVPVASQVNMGENMVFDAIGPQLYCDHEMNESEDARVEEPNAEAQNFFNLLEAANTPLYNGHEDLTQLSMCVNLMTLKSEGNWSQESFNKTLALMKRALPSDALLPKNYYEAKKLMSKLGLKVERIDCCVNGCMLFRDEVTTRCSFCDANRYVVRQNGRRKSKKIPRKRLFYFPLIPRLQRLFASMRSAPHMRWHHENRREPGVLCHPSDGEAWKKFDDFYPEFASEPRNVRLGLCSDGFNPFSNSAISYSCWPVIVTPYNLPPEMCMTTPYMFLSLIIPGPRSPKQKIDVYLQPLIDELKFL